MIKFILEADSETQRFTAVESVEFKVNEHSGLPDVLEAFQNFLYAAGYRFDGNLEVVEPEEVITRVELSEDEEKELIEAYEDQLQEWKDGDDNRKSEAV